PEVTIEDPTITNPREREKAFGQDDHVRMFGKDYSKRIERAGLQAEENMFGETQSDRYGISKNEIIYLGRK
ncbi:MAG: SAM-dependent methyltransferase, partial [Bacteroidia bacterium]|nr:SAM-dependent methyltransferase [Bacteroidia bacterium]